MPRLDGRDGRRSDQERAGQERGRADVRANTDGLERASVRRVVGDGAEGGREVERARLVEDVEAGAGQGRVEVRRVGLLVGAEDAELGERDRDEEEECTGQDGARRRGPEEAGWALTCLTTAALSSAEKPAASRSVALNLDRPCW